MLLNLFKREIDNLFTRLNFEKIEREINDDQLLKAEWVFREIIFPAAVTNFRYVHNLNFVPKDVIKTSEVGAGVATFNMNLFNSTSVDITTSGPVTVRVLFGRLS